MNRRLFGALGVITVLIWAGACKEDPLSDLDGNPAAIITDFSSLELAIGADSTITAWVVDGRATPLALPLTFTACSGAVSVVPNPDYHPVPATSAQAIVTAVSVTAGSCVQVAGGGITDSVAVVVTP